MLKPATVMMCEIWGGVIKIWAEAFLPESWKNGAGLVCVSK